MQALGRAIVTSIFGSIKLVGLVACWQSFGLQGLVTTDSQIGTANGRKLWRPVISSRRDPRAQLEWQLFSPRISIPISAYTANFSLRARAAQNHDDRVGLCLLFRCDPRERLLCRFF